MIAKQNMEWHLANEYEQGFFSGGPAGVRVPLNILCISREKVKILNVRIPAKPTPYVLWIFMWCIKFYVAYVCKIRCLVIFKLTRSATRLTKNGTCLSIEHATEIAGIIGDRWGADKYKQVFSKPLGALFVYVLRKECKELVYTETVQMCARVTIEGLGWQYWYLEFSSPTVFWRHFLSRCFLSLRWKRVFNLWSSVVF